MDGSGNQPPNPSSNPDYLVDGEFRDVKSPTTDAVPNVLKNQLDSVFEGGQAQNLDLNLGRSDFTTDDIRDVLDSIIELSLIHI